MFQRNSAQSSHLKYERYHQGESRHYLAYETNINGKLDVDALKSALTTIMQRHDLLHSGINLDGGDQPFIYSTDSTLPLTIIDATSNNSSAENLRRDALSKAVVYHGTPWGRLWRAILIKTAPDEWQLTIACHPLMADAHAMHLLFSELQHYYHASTSDQDLPVYIPGTEEPSTDTSAHHAYWKKKLNDLTITKLQTPKSFNGNMRFNGKQLNFNLEKHLTDSLQNAMPDHNLQQILLTALYSLLYRYTGETDITLGTTHPNRQMNDNRINACTSWLPLRLNLSGNLKFSDVLTELGKTQDEAISHPLTIEEIYQTVLSDATVSNLKTTAPFDVMLKFNEKAVEFALNDLAVTTPQPVDLGFTDSPLFQLHVDAHQDGSYTSRINFNTDLFDDASIKRLQEHLLKILRAAAENPECNLGDIPLLTQAEIAEISALNDNDAAFSTLMAPDAFHEIASQIPEHTALVFHPLNGEPQRTNFRKLDQYTNQIANFLRNHCRLKPGDRIALSIGRSTNLAAMMLGALKAGLIIVPLETSPDSLFTHKLKNAGAKLILTDQHTHSIFEKERRPEYDIGNSFILNIDNPFIKHRLKQTDAAYHPVNLTADSPAYIMFSSGTSTGIPKASLMTHGGLANLLYALRNQGYAQGLKILCTALPTFDAFLFDFLAAWANNGTVHLSSDEERYSPDAIERIIRNEGINFAVFLPDLMSILPRDLPLDYTISMGAAPREGTFDEWLGARPGRKVINGLGHTETGICLSLQEYHPGADPELIGTPINNMKMYVLHPEHHTLCPIGVPGEIFVAGPGLASEYAGNPELTRQKFLTMKFDHEKNQFIACSAKDKDAVYLYASGDLACYQHTTDGTLSIKAIGRNDRRIKLFGVSIDLDGVQALINSNDHVAGSVVVPKPDKSGLVAYVIRKPKFRSTPANKEREAIRKHLRSTLLHPIAYPRHIIFMTAFPLTANGKIDLRKLPQPVEQEIGNKPAPAEDIIGRITKLWHSVLGSDISENIDTHASFQALGGNSIMLAMLENMLNRHFSLTRHIGVGEKFLSKTMTISSLTEAVLPYLAQSASSNPAATHQSSISNAFSKTSSLFANRSSISDNYGENISEYKMPISGAHKKQ